VKIAIIGQGYVGSAFKKLVEKHYEIVTYDPAVNATYPEEEISDCELAVVCVPTPMGDHKECDTSIVEEAVSRLNNQHILIKSTVSPGTTERLQKATGQKICFSPEYIGESTYHNPVYTSMKDTSFLVIGGPKDERAYMFDIFEPVMGPYTQYFGCEATEAELIKYMANSYFAAKVTFVNEFYEIAQRFGADWRTIREGWLLDERIGRGSSSVFVNKRGFDGKCLPKDVNAIVQASEKQGYSPGLLKEVLNSNDRFQNI
jgi:UDPglucose 6-dehydrogenase